MERPLIRGVAPQMRDQAAYLALGGGAGSRSLGSIYLIDQFLTRIKAPIAVLWLGLGAAP